MPEAHGADSLRGLDAGIAKAIAAAREQTQRSIGALQALVRIPSLTGEEGEAQKHMAGIVRGLGAEVLVEEPDVKAMFEAFPEIAQYPTHWQHDLILPYEALPTNEALVASGLENVLNYRGRPNVVGRFAGSGGGRSLILNGHVDTVTLEPRHEWKRDPFGAEIEGGKLYGRGSSDMKGGLMAALMALTYLREAGVRLAGDVTFQSVVNEEHAGNGTLDLVRRGQKADAAVVLEPTNNAVCVSHPGGLYWQVTVPGRARSPGARWRGTEQQGMSAIEKLPPLIDALLAIETHYNQSAGDPDAPAPFSLVIGKVSGGHYETVTASEAQLRGGAYFQPGVGEIGEVMQRFRESVRTVNAADSFLCACPARVEFLHHDDSTLQPPDIEIARYMGTLLANRGGNGAVKPGPFACDMRHLVNQGGMPAIIFGPGSIAEAHRPDEHISVAEYLACIEHLVEFVARWCNQSR